VLNQTYSSAPIPYLTYSSYAGPWDFGADYHANTAPYIENLGSILGFCVQNWGTATSASSAFLFMLNNASYSPSWAFFAFQWETSTGAFVARYELNLGGFNAGVVQTRAGMLYAMNNVGTVLTAFGFSASAITWGTLTYAAADYGRVGWGGAMAIDEMADRLLIADAGNLLSVYQISTKTRLYQLPLPTSVAAIALEDAGRAYVLLGNRILLLFNYAQRQVLGAVRVPASPSGAAYWNNGNVTLTWDPLLRHILIFEKVANNSDGSCASIVRGYLQIPVPTRLTTPVPLAFPRQGKTIPVLAQLVGDMNEGVAGALATVTVSGGGALAAQLPLTDNLGRVQAQVVCNSAASTTVNVSVNL